MAWRPFFSHITPDPDPMRHVRAARERGIEPVMHTGYDSERDMTCVYWYVPDIDLWVMEGAVAAPEPDPPPPPGDLALVIDVGFGEYRAECRLCGWVGNTWFLDPGAAAAEAAAHESHLGREG